MSKPLVHSYAEKTESRDLSARAIIPDSGLDMMSLNGQCYQLLTDVKSRNRKRAANLTKDAITNCKYVYCEVRTNHRLKHLNVINHDNSGGSTNC
jgi:hypothetical protein